MRERIKSFISLGLKRKIVLIQALGASFYSFILFTFFKKFARFGKKVDPANNEQMPDNRVNDIAWPIQAMGKITPWQSVCRHQAYQAKLLCNYYNIPCLIFIGFKKNRETQKIEAHAWTVAGSKIITGFCNPDEYIVQNIYRNKWL